MAVRRALILLAPLLVPPSTAAAQQADLGAESAHLQDYRGQAGKRLTYVCPPRATGRLYGTDVYTDDSSICAAAVHAGVTTADKGGPVTVVIGEAQQRFAGSSRNGVTSQKFADWPGSFSLARQSGPAAITWGTTARGVQGYTGTLTVTCPEGGRVKEVWGTDSYTSDSSICSAAVHAGAISLARGGPVTIRMTEGRKAYEASSRNGVASRDYGSWETSFEVRPASLVTAAPPTAIANQTTTMAPAQQGTSPATTTAVAPTPTRTGVAPPTDGRTLPATGTAPVAAVVSATGFKGVAGPKYSGLSWNPAPGSVGYRLTRYDPTTQQRVTLRTPDGDTVFAATAYTDTAVTPNRTYGYRLRTHFRDVNDDLVADPDTSAGVSVTPKDPNAPLPLPPNFGDTVTIKWSFSPIDSAFTMTWDWRTGAEGYRITGHESGSEMTYQVGSNGTLLDVNNIDRPAKDWSGSKYLKPFAATKLTWPRGIGGRVVFCIYAVSPVDPTTGKRVESSPGILKMEKSYDTGGKWVQKPWYESGFSTCPSPPRVW